MADLRPRPPSRPEAPRTGAPFRARTAARACCAATSCDVPPQPGRRARLVVLVLLRAPALAAPWIAPQNPYDLSQLDIMDNMLAPGEALGVGSTAAWLGTDDQGRDMLSAILYGLRISLAVGASSVLIACAHRRLRRRARGLCGRPRRSRS